LASTIGLGHGLRAFSESLTQMHVREPFSKALAECIV